MTDKKIDKENMLSTLSELLNDPGSKVTAITNSSIIVRLKGGEKIEIDIKPTLSLRISTGNINLPCPGDQLYEIIKNSSEFNEIKIDFNPFQDKSEYKELYYQETYSSEHCWAEHPWIESWLNDNEDNLNGIFDELYRSGAKVKQEFQSNPEVLKLFIMLAAVKIRHPLTDDRAKEFIAELSEALKGVSSTPKTQLAAYASSHIHIRQDNIRIDELALSIFLEEIAKILPSLYKEENIQEIKEVIDNAREEASRKATEICALPVDFDRKNTINPKDKEEQASLLNMYNSLFPPKKPVKTINEGNKKDAKDINNKKNNNIIEWALAAGAFMLICGAIYIFCSKSTNKIHLGNEGLSIGG